MVTVTLRAGYLARNVGLVVRNLGGRRWTVYGLDSVGVSHLVTVEGEAAPFFRTRREAVAYLDGLGAPALIWARPESRPYVRPATGRPVERAASCAAH